MRLSLDEFHLSHWDTLVGTAGNVADVTQAHALVHGDEIAALGGAGYRGVEKRPENIGKAVT